MNEEFVQHALSNGEAGAFWLQSLPTLIETCEKQWSLKVFPPFPLTYNYVAPCIRSDGTHAVLKIGFPQDREFQTEIEALSVFQGEGIEKLLQADKDNAVLLLERVTPGVPLSTIKDDEEATRNLATVMKRLWKPLPEKHRFITIAEWAEAIPRLRRQYQGTSGPLPAHLVDKAERLFTELIASSAEPVLVHGDLHHDNVLSSKRTGWLAIDPKGIAAEPAYETAAMLRNPRTRLQHHPDIKKILTRRILVMSEALQIEPQRIYQWGLAQTVLSAVWSAVDERKGWEHAIAVAEMLDTMTF
jgi:streptomycin 6-kinase